MQPQSIHFEPVTAERWHDLETLFGKNGACSGCWCMWWRQTRAQYTELHGEGNRQSMQAIVASGTVPGILAYVDDQPAGWCSIAPREQFPSLDRSRNLKPVDAQPVWSIVCFFVGRGYRRKGLTSALIRGALAFARGQGAQIVEAYPVDRGGPVDTQGDFTGVASTFRNAGFVEVARRSPNRPGHALQPHRDLRYN